MSVQPSDSILIVDFGSQVTQLIARRVREAGVYSEIAPFGSAEAAYTRMQPKGVILSGSPASVLDADGPRIPQVLPHLENAGVKIVIDHIGRPDPVLGANCPGFEAVTRSVEKGRTWVKLSAGYRLGSHAAALGRELCRRVGYERMLWASDCPFVGVESTTYQSTIDWLAEVVPDPAMRQVLGLNAIDLYFRDSRPAA